MNLLNHLKRTCLCVASLVILGFGNQTQANELKLKTTETLQASHRNFLQVQTALSQKFKVIERESVGKLEGRWSEFQEIPIYEKDVKPSKGGVLHDAALGGSIGFSLGGLISLPFFYTASPILAIPALLGTLLGAVIGSTDTPTAPASIRYKTVEKTKGTLHGEWYQINKTPSSYSVVVLNEQTANLINLKQSLNQLQETNCTQKVIAQLEKVKKNSYVQTSWEFMEFVGHVEALSSSVQELYSIASQWEQIDNITRYESIKKTAQEYEGLNAELGGLRSTKLFIDYVDIRLEPLINDPCEPTKEAAAEYIISRTLSYFNFMSLLVREPLEQYPRQN